jgi:hypothetical protein
VRFLLEDLSRRPEKMEQETGPRLARLAPLGVPVPEVVEGEEEAVPPEPVRQGGRWRSAN